jgi:hypothetical protein
MLSFQLFSNRKRNFKRIGFSPELRNPNNIMVNNIIANQKKYSQFRSFNRSMIAYANSPSATCGCGSN